MLDCGHQSIEVGAQCREAGGIEQQSALAAGIAGSARAGTSGLREGDLLMVAQRRDFVVRQAQLRVWDGWGSGRR